MDRSLAGGRQRATACSCHEVLVENLGQGGSLPPRLRPFAKQWLGLSGLLRRRSGCGHEKPTGRESCARCAVPLNRRGHLFGQLFWVEPTFQPHIACDVVHELLSQKLPLSPTLDENV